MVAGGNVLGESVKLVTLRDLFLRVLVAWGITLFATTELLSAFDALHRMPLLLCWLATIVLLAAFLRPRLTAASFKLPAAPPTRAWLLCRPRTHAGLLGSTAPIFNWSTL